MSIPKLIKCLEMMSSDHDGEVLNAARMANKLIKSMDMRWEDVVTSQPKKNQPIPTSSPPPSGPGSGFGGFGAGMAAGQYPNDPFWQQRQQYGSQQANYSPDAFAQQAYNQQMHQEAMKRERERQEDLIRKGREQRQRERAEAQRNREMAPEVVVSVEKRDSQKRKSWFGG